MSRTSSPQARRQADVAELYRRYGKMAYRRILRFFAPDEAEEVLQEIFMRVLEKAERLEEASSPATWLYRVTTNHCINRLRNEGRRRELWREHAPGLWEVGDQQTDQEARVLLKQLWRELNDEQIRIGVMAFVDGMSHAEIARIIGCSRRTVGNRLDELRRLAQDPKVSPRAAEHRGGMSDGI